MCLLNLVVRLITALFGLITNIKGVQFASSLVPTPASVVRKLIFIGRLNAYVSLMSAKDGTLYLIVPAPASNPEYNALRLTI